MRNLIMIFYDHQNNIYSIGCIQKEDPAKKISWPDIASYFTKLNYKLVGYDSLNKKATTCHFTIPDKITSYEFKLDLDKLIKSNKDFIFQKFSPL